jgi:hypothetical protein
VPRCAVGQSHNASVPRPSMAAGIPSGSLDHRRGRLRHFLSFLMATAMLLAGVALATAEIGRAEGIRPLLLVGAGLMIGAAGLWLVDEFVWSRRRR